MKIIKTNKLFEEINNVGEFTSVAPVSFSDEVKAAKEQEKKAEEIMDEKEKEVKDLDNTEKQRENGSKIKRPEGSKKIHLEESLFEALEEEDRWGFESAIYRAVLNIVIKYKRKGHEITLADVQDALEMTGLRFKDEDELEEGYKDNPNEWRIRTREDRILDSIFTWLRDQYDDEKIVDFCEDTLGMDEEEVKYYLPDIFEMDEAWRRQPKEGDTYLVSKNRAPVADLIQAYLTEGEHEWGYVKHADGTINPTPLKGAEYDAHQIGIDDDYNITVRAESVEALEDAKKIADKFHKKYEIKDYTGRAGAKRYPALMTIKLEDEDWDEPYVDPDDEVYQGKEIEVEDESLDTDMVKVKHDVDQFKSQITVNKDSEQEVKDYLLKKGISFMIDDSNISNGKLTFKLNYKKVESLKEKYYSDKEKSDKEFVKSAIHEMNRYIRNWDFMSAKEKKGIGCTLDELKARVKELESVKNESLKEYFSDKDSEAIIKWWKDVEAWNHDNGDKYSIDNGDYSDVESMHVAMFDMLKELKAEDSAKDLFKDGKKLYNKYALSKLNEASSIKVLTYNFKPTGEEATTTYSKISEAGKLGQFQDLLENMYPDVDQVDAEEVNKLLSDNADWVLKMLDIHRDEE